MEEKNNKKSKSKWWIILIIIIFVILIFTLIMNVANNKKEVLKNENVEKCAIQARIFIENKNKGIQEQDYVKSFNLTQSNMINDKCLIQYTTILKSSTDTFETAYELRNLTNNTSLCSFNPIVIFNATEETEPSEFIEMNTKNEENMHEYSECVKNNFSN